MNGGEAPNCDASQSTNERGRFTVKKAHSTKTFLETEGLSLHNDPLFVNESSLVHCTVYVVNF